MTALDDRDCLTLSVTQAARILGVGRNTAYEAVRTGAIPSIRVGRRVLVPKAALERLLVNAPLPSDEPEP